MEQLGAKNMHARAGGAPRRRAHSFSLIFDEIFTEDMVRPAAAAAAAAATGSSAFGLPANGHGPNTNAAASAELSGFNSASGGALFPGNFSIWDGGEDLMAGSSAFDLPVNGHGPDTDAAASAELSGFNSGGALFPGNFCIRDGGEGLICSLGPERARVARGEVSFENFLMDGSDGDFVVKLVNFEKENTKAKHDVLDTPPPSFDFASITSKLGENNDSWKSLETKAKHLVAVKMGRPVKATKKKVMISIARSNTPPTTHKRKLATVSADSGVSEEARRQIAAESHRRATAKRSRTQGRFAKRQYVWVNVGEDGRKTAAKK